MKVWLQLLQGELMWRNLSRYRCPALPLTHLVRAAH